MQGTHGEFHGVPYQPAETQALDLQAGVGAGHAIHQDSLTPVTVPPFDDSSEPTRVCCDITLLTFEPNQTWEPGIGFMRRNKGSLIGLQCN